MTIKIHNEGEKDGFCYMHTGIGFSSHSNHIQPGLSVSIGNSKSLTDAAKKYYSVSWKSIRTWRFLYNRIYQIRISGETPYK